MTETKNSPCLTFYVSWTPGKCWANSQGAENRVVKRDPFLGESEQRAPGTHTNDKGGLPVGSFLKVSKLGLDLQEALAPLPPYRKDFNGVTHTGSW